MSILSNMLAIHTLEKRIPSGNLTSYLVAEFQIGVGKEWQNISQNV